jgi:hypothetical protein
MAEEAANPAAAAADLPASALPPGDPGYVEKTLNADLGDVSPQKQPGGPQRPEGVPEQFWDATKGIIKADELAKSYAELRAKMDAGKADEAAGDKTDEDPAQKGVKIERPDAAKKDEKAAEANPLTTAVDAMAKAYAESGDVTEDHIKAVEDLGLPRAVIDTYMAGIKALEANMTAEVHKAAGGEDKFVEAQTWAAKGLSDADLDYYNANIDDPSKRIQTVEWLMAKFSGARPGEGKLVDGLPSTAAAGDVFETPAQVTAAMSDPKYATDPAYRRQVAEKMLRSQKAGTLNSGTQYFTRT